MKYIATLLITSFVILSSCDSKKDQNDQVDSEISSNLNTEQFKQLISKVADGWNTGNARKAADCFSKDAVYIEPPNLQLYQGREELYEFFGGAEGRLDPMKMTWHYLIFDEAKQIGTGEYTFAYKGRLSHGIVIVHISEGKIRRWREYQYRSEIEWKDFIGKSAF